jgi:hypothetical protein
LYQHDPAFPEQHKELLTRQQAQPFPRLAGNHYLIFLLMVTAVCMDGLLVKNILNCLY